jgi:hypothetical protein
MNNKQLAEMIKSLRKMKMEQKLVGSGGPYGGAGADIQDPASPNRKPGSATKEIHHGVVKEDELNEFKRGAIRTHPRIAKKLTGPRQKMQSDLGLQRNKPDRYRLGEDKKSSNTKSTIINTTPEQDSAMIGTQ